MIAAQSTVYLTFSILQCIFIYNGRKGNSHNCKSLSFGICWNKNNKKKQIAVSQTNQNCFLSLIIDGGIWVSFKVWLRPLCRQILWIMKEAKDKRPLNRHAKQSHMSLPI